MGNKIKVDSSIIESVASKLDNINRDIASNFSAMANQVNSLSGSWSGAASTAALDRMNQLFQGEPQRKNVLDNYSKVLHVLVNPNYIQTEDANHGLADCFK